MFGQNVAFPSWTQDPRSSQLCFFVAVAQEKQSWGQTELTAGNYSDTSLTLTAGAMQSGVWRGTLPVNIEYAQAAAGGVTP